MRDSVVVFLFFEGNGDHRDLHVLTHSFPTRRSSELPRPRLVHRLDKDTSGVLLIARTPGSAAFFSRRFSGRSARKIYWALVVGVPEVTSVEDRKSTRLNSSH